MLSKISVTILAKNAQKTLYECLKSVERFDEVILLDNKSSDKTVEIAKQFGNVKIYQVRESHHSLHKKLQDFLMLQIQ